MKYSEVGFRAFYNHFCAVEMTDEMREIMVRDHWQGAKTAQFVLVYGYIDHDKGFTLEVLAACRQNATDHLFVFKDPNNEVRYFLRAETINNLEAYYFEESSRTKYRQRYAKKLEFLDHYKESKAVEESRELTLLDESRHPFYVDDVQVLLQKEEYRNEKCYVRILNKIDHIFIGQLVNEPDQDFELKIGDTLAFYVKELENNKAVCIANMNRPTPDKKVEKNSGERLEEAINYFVNDKTEDNMYNVFSVLKDSKVWIVGSAVIDSKTDNRQFNLQPQIIKNKDGDKFLPVYTSEKHMNTEEKTLSKLSCDIYDVLELAKNHEEELLGIMINPFSDPFLVPEEFYELFDNMESNLVS